MELIDCRTKTTLCGTPVDENIINLEGASEAGTVAIDLAEGYRVHIRYEEIERIVKAMDGYTKPWRLSCLKGGQK